jgi:hypothetical protein
MHAFYTFGCLLVSSGYLHIYACHVHASLLALLNS